MYLKNGVLTKGPPPKSGSDGPRIITHRSQRTPVASSGRRLDALLEGKARICIKRSLGGLGDIIMATPISRGAKRKYPNSHLTFAVPTGYAGGDLVALLENNPYIDEVIDYSLVNRDDYDTFTDITKVGLSDEKPYSVPSNRIDLFANAAGIPLFGNYTPVYVMTEDEKKWGQDYVEKILRGKKYRGIISMHLASRDPKRSWPANRSAEFVRYARDNGYFCFLFEWGASKDQWRLANSEAVFDYGIRQAAAVMTATDVLVCPDSMMLHLAGALSMKTIALFGSMPPACRINHYPNATAVVNHEVSCLGCVYAPCTNDYYCMSSILPQSVLSACEKKIAEATVSPDSEASGPMVEPGVSTTREIGTFTM